MSQCIQRVHETPEWLSIMIICFYAACAAIVITCGVIAYRDR